VGLYLIFYIFVIGLVLFCCQRIQRSA